MMRVQTQNEAHEDRLGPNGESPTRPKLPRRSQRSNHRRYPQQAQPEAGEASQTPTFNLPAHAGLALPRLVGVPTHYSIDNAQAVSAQIALLLLDAGIVQDSDDDDDTNPSSLIKRSLARTLGDALDFPGLDLEFRLHKQDGSDGYFLLVFVEGTIVIDFGPIAHQLDVIHPQLGPSLLTYLYRNLDLTPAFTPAVALDHIQMSYWYGLDDDSALLEQAQDELAHQTGHKPGAFSHEDVVSYAEEHYLTHSKVSQRLEPRYQHSGSLSLRECLALCQEHRLGAFVPVIESLERLGSLRDALPDDDPQEYECDGDMPFSLVLSLGGKNDLVTEIHDEFINMLYQSGMDFAPSYVLAFDPSDSSSVDTLKNALTTCRLVLEETNRLIHALEAL